MESIQIAPLVAGSLNHERQIYHVRHVHTDALAHRRLPVITRDVAELIASYDTDAKCVEWDYYRLVLELMCVVASLVDTSDLDGFRSLLLVTWLALCG